MTIVESRRPLPARPLFSRRTRIAAILGTSAALFAATSGFAAAGRGAAKRPAAPRQQQPASRAKAPLKVTKLKALAKGAGSGCECAGVVPGSTPDCPIEFDGTAENAGPPQSLVPTGAFVAAPAPSSPYVDLAELQRWVRAVLPALGTPAAAGLPEVRALGDAIQDRDARLAAKNPPRRVASAGPQG